MCKEENILSKNDADTIRDSLLLSNNEINAIFENMRKETTSGYVCYSGSDMKHESTMFA